MNSKSIPILSILLVVQVALTFALDYADKSKKNDTGKKILTADLAQVDQIVLAEEKRKVTIRKVGQKWTLPDVYNFPASTESVSRLLDQLKSLNGNWPVASSDDAAPRFRVSDNEYKERIDLKTGDKNVATVLIGSSAGHNKLHLRVDKAKEIFAVDLPEREVSTESGDWIDRGAVELESDDINCVELPQLKLTRKNQKDFELSYGGKVASIDAGAASEVLESVGGVNISDVLGTSNKPEYGLDAPVLTFTVEVKNGKKLVYKFGKLAGTNFLVLAKPEGQFYLKIDSWFVERLRNLSADALIKKSALMTQLERSNIRLIDKTKTPPKDLVKHP